MADILTPTLRRRDLLLSAAGTLPFLAAQRALAAGKKYFVYWGTYTAGGPRYGTGESKGIYVSTLDPATGDVSAPQLVAETENPSFMCFHPKRTVLYAVNEHIDETGKEFGGVSAFALDRKTGKLTPLNKVSSKGGMPCHLNTDKTGKMLAVANWSTGSVATFQIKADGSLSESTGFDQHGGERSGATNPGRNGQPPAVQVHCHSVIFSADNRFLIATDTGLNKVFVYRPDLNKGTVAAHEPPFLGLKTNVNPRHLAFHPNGKWAYLANEAGTGCSMLSYDAKKGTFEEHAVTKTVPDGGTRGSQAEVYVHPNGKFVYVSNRGHDSIAILQINQSDGSTTLVEPFQPGGNQPRSFGIDPTGTWLFACMQRSNNIMKLKIDGATGKLTKVGDPISLPVPVCAQFVEQA